MLLLLSFFFLSRSLFLTYTSCSYFNFFFACFMRSPLQQNLVNIHTISLSLQPAPWARKRKCSKAQIPGPVWHDFPLSTFHARSTWIFHIPSDAPTQIRQLWTNFPLNFSETIHSHGAFSDSFVDVWSPTVLRAAWNIIKFYEIFTQSIFAHLTRARRLFKNS